MFTKLERQIILHRVVTALCWSALVVVTILAFNFSFVIGVFWLLFVPFGIWFLQMANLYFPHRSYFRYYFRNHSREERWQFSERAERFGEYTIIGDIAFLDEYVIIKKIGILIEYQDIKKITYTTGPVGYAGGFVYRLRFELYDHNRTYRYSIYNDASPFVGSDSQFSHALKWVQSHRNLADQDSICQNEDNSNV